MRKLLLIGLLVFYGSAQAADTAFMARETELKAKPFADAPTLATLAEQTKVEILTRQASWMQIKNRSWHRLGQDAQRTHG